MTCLNGRRNPIEFQNLATTRKMKNRINIMDDPLYEKNRLLQRKLDNLIKQAQTNERKQQLYESFGFDIIGVTTPAQLSELLLC